MTPSPKGRAYVSLSAHEYARKLFSFSDGVDDVTERHRAHREQIDALAVRIDRALKEAGL